MPQAGSQSTSIQVAQIGVQEGRPIFVAQAGEGEGHAAPSAEGEAHAGAEGHAAAGHHAEPLGEHYAPWYSAVGFGIALAILIFAKSRMGKLTARNPSKGQLLIEQAVASITHFSKSSIGPGGERFAPFVGTVFAFVLFSNLCGVLPMYWWSSKHNPGGPAWSFTPAPTANISMTFALGFIVFVLFNWEGIKANGVGGHLKHFMGPIPALAILIFPIEVIGALVRPVSLAMRLFGNVFGEETVIAVLITMAATATMGLIPFQVPMLAFGVFGSIVQAGVFAILTCSYIALSIGDHDHGHGEEGHDGHGAAHAH